MRRPKYASVSLSLFLSLFCVCLSLSLSFSRSSLSFFPFFFFPSLGYFLYFLFARLGMACSSSASLPSRPLSSTRSRSFFALVGVVALGDPKPGFPVVLVSCLGFARGDPTWGLSVSFGFPCSVCFLLGSSPGFGARGFLPPKKWFFLQEKRETSPLVEGVCVRSGRRPCHQSFLRQQGDHPFAVCDGPTKRPQQMRISRLITSTYLCISCDSKSFWPAVSFAVCASCSFG